MSRHRRSASRVILPPDLTTFDSPPLDPNCLLMMDQITNVEKQKIPNRSSAPPSDDHGAQPPSDGANNKPPPAKSTA